MFEALIRSEPEVARYVELDVRRHELRDFLRRYPAFGDLPPDGMRMLLGGLVRSAVSAGELVIRQGEPTGPMYIVRQGRLRATSDATARVTARVSASWDAFGEVSLLRGTDSHRQR